MGATASAAVLAPGTLSVPQARSILLGTGDAISALSARTATGRRLNLYSVVTHPDAGGPLPAPPVSTPSSSTGSGTVVPSPGAASTGTGTAGTGVTSPSPLAALRTLARSAKARCLRSKGRPTCRITATGRARVRLKLAKGTRTLLRGRGRLGARIVMSGGRRIRPGRYTLVITLIDRAGRKVSVKRKVTIR